MNDLLDEQARRAIKQQSADLSIRVQAEIQSGTATSIQYVVAMACKEATEALVMLISVSPDDPQSIRTLQNTIMRQVDLVEWLNKAVITGKEAWSELESEQRTDIEDAVLSGLQEED